LPHVLSLDFYELS